VARAKSPASRKPRPSKRSPSPAASLAGTDESDLVVMGRIVGAFGIHGWAKVKPFTEQAATLGDFALWAVRTSGGWRAMRLEDFEVHSKGPVAKLEGCDDRAAADALRGCDVAIARTQLGDAGDGSLYWIDLVGLEVVDEAGMALGKVEGLFETGETSVLVVRGAAQDAKERMIPFVPTYVKAVDCEAKRITVDWKADYDA
jgi:16S rRNA processing protein RimM